ncbi:MAG TPA: tetratricopeptide repeat protein [Hyphomonadaceae bacterium]
MRVAIVSMFLAASPACAFAQNAPLERCTTLSFAPLDVNVPACTALIEANEARDPETLALLLAARAEAYEFAITYRGEHIVNPAELLADALADLDRAAGMDPRHHMARGDILFRLSRFEDAAASFTSAIASAPADAPALLERRSMALAAANDTEGAIDDLTAAIRLTTRDADRVRLLLQRAPLLEAASDRAGAISDYRAAARIDPDRPGPREALSRLGADAD